MLAHVEVAASRGDLGSLHPGHCHQTLTTHGLCRGDQRGDLRRTTRIVTAATTAAASERGTGGHQDAVIA